MCGPVGVAAAGLQGKHQKAVFEKNKGWCSGSSSSSKKGSLVIKKKSLRGCVQRWSCSVSSKDWAMHSKRMESRREEEAVWKSIARCRLRITRTARKSWMSDKAPTETAMEPMLRDRQKESWKEKL